MVGGSRKTGQNGCDGAAGARNRAFLKVAPSSGAAKRTLDGEDRSESMVNRDKGSAKICRRRGQRSGPFSDCHQHKNYFLGCSSPAKQVRQPVPPALGLYSQLWSGLEQTLAAEAANSTGHNPDLRGRPHGRSWLRTIGPAAGSCQPRSEMPSRCRSEPAGNPD